MPKNRRNFWKIFEKYKMICKKRYAKDMHKRYAKKAQRKKNKIPRFLDMSERVKRSRNKGSDARRAALDKVREARYEQSSKK